MKQFRFKLEAVLEYRDRQLTHAQLELAREEQARCALQQEIVLRESGIRQAIRETASLPDELAFNATLAFGFSEYIQQLKREKERLQKTLTEHEGRLTTLREALRLAMVRKKSLELLKEKAHKGFLRLVDKAEEAFLEELSARVCAGDANNAFSAHGASV